MFNSKTTREVSKKTSFFPPFFGKEVDVNVCVGYINNEIPKLQRNSFITTSLVVVFCFLVVVKDENLFRFIMF